MTAPINVRNMAYYVWETHTTLTYADLYIRQCMYSITHVLIPTNLGLGHLDR